MSYAYDSVWELAVHVDSEGGLLKAAFGYGIPSEEIADPEMRALWAEMEAGYRVIIPVIRRIEQQLHDALDAGNPDDLEYDEDERNER